MAAIEGAARGFVSPPGRPVAEFAAPGLPGVLYPDLAALRTHAGNADAASGIGRGPADPLAPLTLLQRRADWDPGTCAVVAAALSRAAERIPLDGLDPFDRPALHALISLLRAATRSGADVAVTVHDGRLQAAEAVARTLLAHRYRPGPGEVRWQPLLADALTAAGYAVAREVPIGPRERIDILTGRTAVEVKVRGTVADVKRQLARYAACPDVDAIVLATTVARHRSVPREIDGIPVVVAWLSGVIG